MSLTKVPVATTLPTSPLPAADSRGLILTSRLLLRPLSDTDLAAAHRLRTQQNVMVWTSTGKVDDDLEATKIWLDRFLPPKDESTYNWAILSRDGENKGEWIGVGGCHLFLGPDGWPEIGYMLREEYWGQGLASEFVRALISSWWTLPRSRIDTEVTIDTLATTTMSEDTSASTNDVVELLLAETESKNAGSNRTLEKSGFEIFREWDEDEFHLLKWRLKRPVT